MKWFKKKVADLSPKGAAALLWAEKAREKVHNEDWNRNLWQSHPMTQGHLNRHMTGDPDKNWLMYVKEQFCPEPRAYGLSLGCGEGVAERDTIRLGICRKMDAYDLSPGAIEAARKQAHDASFGDSIHYQIADLDNISLPAATYDLIIAGQSVHHVSNLEHLAEELHRSMTPDGILVVNEYVGPSRYQWSDKVEKLMNDLLNILPLEKRRMPGTSHHKREIRRPTPEQVIAADPTESVRSAEIMPILHRHFDTVYHANFGGTLLQFLLSDIIANFHEKAPMDQALIDMLVYFEETLIREGVIDSDFVFAVMRPKPR